MAIDPNNPLRHGNGGSRPVPDPTLLTDKALERLEKSLTIFVNGQLAIRDERLRGIDEATRLRLDAVGATADQFSEQVERLREVHDEKFSSIGTQFVERDTRAERESRDNKVAVDAAFAAQKEAAAKQDEANAKAIDKSEASTRELLGLLSNQISAIKERLDRGEGREVGGIDARAVALTVAGLAIGAAGLALAFLR